MKPEQALQLFSAYLRITGVAHIDAEPGATAPFAGKRLGLLNGSSWVTLWSNYFGRVYLPGVHLVNAGNEAVQINFMQAHSSGQPVPPQTNVQAFIRYAQDLVELAQVDAVLITCSTMNRAYHQVRNALASNGVPVFQIDRPMMERAINQGGRVLVVATHGPDRRKHPLTAARNRGGIGQDRELFGDECGKSLACPGRWRCNRTQPTPGRCYPPVSGYRRARMCGSGAVIHDCLLTFLS